MSAIGTSIYSVRYCVTGRCPAVAVFPFRLSTIAMHLSMITGLKDTADLKKEMTYLLSNHKSFNLYVVHGGTNFGFTAGANAFSPVEYQPDLTSYDYDAPINEQ